MKIVLASTSAYRRMLLERLQLPFETDRPETDESPLPDALIIGSDQVAHLGDEVFGKPGTEARAIAQLQRMRGQTVVFHTALAVLDTRSGLAQIEGVPTHVRFRDLGDEEIRRYVERERPLDCAGSAKSEGLGITLLDALAGEDPNALVGLPLIALCDLLRNQGVRVL